MAEVQVTHEEHSGSEIHLPDPSPWPFVAGLAALLFGLALVWWSGDRNSTVAGVVMGAALAGLAFTVTGWAIEDSGMLRKAKAGHGHGPRQPRYTQVVTFAVPESAGNEAAAAVVAELENATSTFRDLDGFQDLRIVASPSDAGPAQVLVETTWSGRSELEGYAGSQQTVLDIINAHPDAVVPGSVQTFDMEVVRDTKDVSFNFSTSAAVILFGALAVGGLVFAAGLSVFQEDTGGGGGQVPADGGGGGGGGGGAFNGTIAGINTAFDPKDFEVPPSTEITLTFDNQDNGIPHNIEIFSTAEPGAGDLLTGCTDGCQDASSGAETDEVMTVIEAGPAQHTFTFTTPADVGDYGYWCVVHTSSMRGVMHVVEGAPVPGGAPAGGGQTGGGEQSGGGAATASTIEVGDNFFEPDTLSVPVGTAITWNWTGAVPHNVASTDGGPLSSAIQTEGTYEFTFDTAGTYDYHCEVHPTEMTGTIEVTG